MKFLSAMDKVSKGKKVRCTYWNNPEAYICLDGNGMIVFGLTQCVISVFNDKEICGEWEEFTPGSDFFTALKTNGPIRRKCWHMASEYFSGPNDPTRHFRLSYEDVMATDWIVAE